MVAAFGDRVGDLAPAQRRAGGRGGSRPCPRRGDRGAYAAAWGARCAQRGRPAAGAAGGCPRPDRGSRSPRAGVPARRRRGEPCRSARPGTGPAPPRVPPRSPGCPGEAVTLTRSPLFTRPRGVLVRAHAGGVDVDDPLHRLAVVVDLDVSEDPVPGAVRGPPPQPLMAGLPRPRTARGYPATARRSPASTRSR